MTGKDDLISIIVPIYNIEQYIGFCIESLIKQTYKNLEIILVDDGSTDRCPAICDLYADKDARITVIHKENGGLVSARKAGVKIASGAYIGHVDGDDWIEPDYYEALHRSAIRANADIVCAGYSRDLFSKSVKCGNNILDGIYEGTTLEALYGEMLSYTNSFNVGITTYVWNKLFKSEIARAAQRNVDERINIGEDAAVVYPALLRAQRIYICDNSSYHYRQHEGSMLKRHAGFEKEQKRLGYLYEYLKGVFEEDKHKEILLPQLQDYIVSYCIIRSGGIVGGTEMFGKDIRDKRVVIIQAGTTGQVMYERLSEYCTVVGWYDTDYWEYRRCCMNVDPIEEIGNKEFDYALIAKMDQENIENTKTELVQLGVREEKILSIDYEKLDRGEMLRQYLEDCAWAKTCY